MSLISSLGKKRKRIVISYVFSLIFIGTLLLGGCASEKTANSSDQKGSEPVAQTTQVSGSLVFYTSQPDTDAQALVDAFQKKYPDVQVNTFRSGTEEVVAKIRSEKIAGNVQADVLLLADAVTFESLREEGVLEAYRSPEADNIPEAFIGPDNTYYGTKVMATVLVYNTTSVSQKPDTWNILISPETKGKAVMPSPLYSGAAAYNLGVFVRQKEFGWNFYEKLAQNEMTVVKGNGGVLTDVAKGEKTYGMIVDFMAARAKKEGSPVDFTYPKEGVPVITEPVAVVKDTKHQAAAHAFVDFILSEEGQKLQASLGYVPIRSNITPPEGLKSVDEIHVLSTDIQELVKQREAEKQRFSEIFQ